MKLGLTLILFTILTVSCAPSSSEPNNCDIKHEDLDGYLLKICRYLREHNDTVGPNKNPDDYQIESVFNGTYSGSGFSYDAIVVQLDCCYGMGDLAYLDKDTEEVIGFSPGDR